MRNRRNIHAKLEQVGLFRGMGRAALEIVGSVTTEVERPAGTVFTREGAPGLEAFVILEGEATVKVGGRLVGVVGPGDVFGEMALLERGPRTATVMAVTPMRVLALSRAEFRSLLDRVPEVDDRVRAAAAARVA